MAELEVHTSSSRAMTYLHFGRAGTKCQGFKTHKSLGWHGERCVKASYRPKFVLPYQTKRRLEVQAEKKAVIIVDHGSKRKASNDQLDQFVSLYRNSDSGQMVIGAHMELASPSIKEAVKMCVEAGYSKITVAPYFLSNGRHIQEDIPALVDEAQSQFQDISCTIADPIGLDTGVVEILKRRVQAAESKQNSSNFISDAL